MKSNSLVYQSGKLIIRGSQGDPSEFDLEVLGGVVAGSGTFHGDLTVNGTIELGGQILLSGEVVTGGVVRGDSGLVSGLDLEVQRDATIGRNAFIGGDLTVTNNLYVNGETIMVDSKITTADRVIVMNDGEQGSGVTGDFAGIIVDRGTEANYEFGFNEETRLFELGETGDRQPVATTEDAPLDGGIMRYSTTKRKLESISPSVIRTYIGAAQNGTGVNQVRTNAQLDSRYYTKALADEQISGPSSALQSHKSSSDHDERYYTKSQSNVNLSILRDELGDEIADVDVKVDGIDTRLGISIGQLEHNYQSLTQIVNDIDRDSEYTEYRYRRSPTQPPTPTDLEPAQWTIEVPTGGDILWITAAIKLGDKSGFAGGSTWATPWQFSGSSGETAKNLRLAATAQSFHFNGDGDPFPENQVITFTASANNLVGSPTFSTTPSVTLSGSGDSRTLSVLNFGSHPMVKVTATQGGITDEITVVRLEDGATVVSGYLTNETHVVATTASGENFQMDGAEILGAGGRFKVYKGILDITSQCTYDIQTDRVYWSLTESAGEKIARVGDSNNIQMRINTTTGVYRVLTDEDTKGWNTDFEWFTLVARYGGVPVAEKRYSIAKSKAGAIGGDGRSQATLYLYSRGETTPVMPNTDVTYTFADGSWTAPTGWSKSIPAVPESEPVWVIAATASGIGATDIIGHGEWTDPPIKLAERGIDGLNTAVVYAYQRVGYDIVVNPISQVTTYRFSDATLSNLDSGWSTDIQTSGTGQVLWVTQATAFNRGDTDSISVDDWSVPTIMSIDGTNGNSAKTIRLSATAQTFHFNGNGTATPSGQEITLTAYKNNLAEGNPVFTTNPAVTLTGTGDVRKLSVANFGPTHESVTVTVTHDGVTDDMTIIRLVDGTHAVNGYLTNETHVMATDSDGNNYGMSGNVLAGAGGQFKVFSGTNDITTGCTFGIKKESHYPAATTDGSGYVNTRIGTGSTNNLQMYIHANNGDYRLESPNTADQWKSDSEWFTLTATYRGVVVAEKTYSITKSKAGAKGDAGTPGSPGIPGKAGASFYSGEITLDYPGTAYIPQALLSPAFEVISGRSPVIGDIYVVTYVGGTGTGKKVTYEFVTNSGSGTWAVSAFTIDGSLVATGSIGAEHLMATAINGHVITGATYITTNVGSEYVEVKSATPFGTQSTLYEWFGKKVNGVTWNNSTNVPIPSGMSTVNSKTHKTINGDVYFGGTFQAGSLYTSKGTSEHSPTATVTTSFGSNGGALVIACSMNYYRSVLNTSTTCPVGKSTITGELILEEYNGSTWTLLKSENVAYTYECTPRIVESGDTIDGIYSNSASRSYTFTADQRSGTRQFRARLRNMTGTNYSSVGAISLTQVVTIVSTEE